MVVVFMITANIFIEKSGLYLTQCKASLDSIIIEPSGSDYSAIIPQQLLEGI
jgi:hypothetical protein